MSLRRDRATGRARRSVADRWLRLPPTWHSFEWLGWGAAISGLMVVVYCVAALLSGLL